MNEAMQKEIDNVKKTNMIHSFDGLFVPFLGARLYIPQSVFQPKTESRVISNGISLSWDSDSNRNERSYIVKRIDIYDVLKANIDTGEDEVFIGRIWIESNSNDVLTIQSNTRIKETPVTSMDRKMRQVYNATLEFNRIAIKWADHVKA